MEFNPEASAIELCGVSCVRNDDGRLEKRLEGLSVSFDPGSWSLILAEDAAESALLFRLLCLREQPDAGDILVGGIAANRLDEESRTHLRAQQFGFSFAAPFLLPSFSVIENIAMPLFRLTEIPTEEARSRAEAALEFVGLVGFENARPDELTAFEQHCVSLARALAAEPRVLLLEDIDSSFGADALSQISQLLKSAAEQLNLAAIGTASAKAQRFPGPDRFLYLSGGTFRSDSSLESTPAP